MQKRSTYCDNDFVSEKVYSTIKQDCSSLVDSLLKVRRFKVFLSKNWLGFRNAILVKKRLM